MTDKQRKSVILVDDHAILREGVKLIVEQEPDLRVVHEAVNATEALACLADQSVDLAIVDISMKGRNGLDLIKELRGRGEGFPIIVLSVHEEATYAERAIRAGAQGYVMKREAGRLLISAIRRVLDGDLYVCEEMGAALLANLLAAPPTDVASRDPVDTLTDRELEVLDMTAKACSPREIAGSLNLSTSTVQTHRENIKRKLSLRSTADLIRFAAQRAASG